MVEILWYLSIDEDDRSRLNFRMRDIVKKRRLQRKKMSSERSRERRP